MCAYLFHVYMRKLINMYVVLTWCTECEYIKCVCICIFLFDTENKNAEFSTVDF